MSVLVPSAWDVAMALAVVALTAAALVLVGGCRALSAGQALVWMLLVLFVPVLGARAWLAASRRLGGGETVRWT